MSYSRMLRCILITIVILSSFVFTACQKDEISEVHPTGMSIPELPGHSIVDIEIDQKGNIFFVTQGKDETVEVPIYSSTIPMRLYLSKLSDGEITILDDRFKGRTILFDDDNNLWAMTDKTISKRSNRIDNTVLDIEDAEGAFNSFAVDSKNNIWVCGLKTGLMKIDPELSITRFHVENSMLPTNSMTSVHIDQFDNVWVALWEHQGILKISADNWTIYNSNNSNITSQNIWCLVTDKFNNVWIGTGADDPEVSLMKFDGDDWIVSNPKGDSGEVVCGTVRTLASDHEKIWVVSNISQGTAPSIHSLTAFDGSKWAEINEVTGEDGIVDIEFDPLRGITWIGTWNKQLYMLPN